MSSYENAPTPGKHMICDIKNIQNHELLADAEGIKDHLNVICETYGFTILHVSEHAFEVQGHTILYMLSESHISVHTFPERNYLAFDIYTCREYPDNTVYNCIYNFLVQAFGATRETPTIIDRKFDKGAESLQPGKERNSGGQIPYEFGS